jgi:hypothetical protein
VLAPVSWGALKKPTEREAFGCKALGKANCEDDDERSELAIPKRIDCKALGKANCEDVDAVDKSEGKLSC